MKSSTILTTITAAMLVIVITACEPSKKNEDSSEAAKDQNDAMIDSRDAEKDADFVVDAVAGNYAEIKLAELAISKSNDSGVKEIANKLEEDHTKILNELKQYADKNGIIVPNEEPNDAVEDRGDLASKSAEDFDKEWCSALQDKHEKTIDKFESQMDKTEDMELKNWIASTLPGLKSHLEMLKQHESAKTN